MIQVKLPPASKHIEKEYVALVAKIYKLRQERMSEYTTAIRICQSQLN